MKGRMARIKREREVVNLIDSRVHEKHRARWPVIGGYVKVLTGAWRLKPVGLDKAASNRG